MLLKELTKSIKISEIKGSADIDISGIHFDSRKIKEGNLFIAVKGTRSDGHDYIGKSVENGATAVVCEYFPTNLEENITYIKVEDSASALGYIASEWFGNPSEKLILVGVTGTNGKTTIATLLYHLFTKSGHKSGLLSTVCNQVADRAVPSTHTTPDPIEINELLSEMAEEECEYAFMEASSHAIAQKRIHGLVFKGGIFTNLTRDHLDYHKTFENYRNAKKAFFDYLPKGAFAITNKDDKNGAYMLQNTKADKYTYSMLSLADFQGKILESHFEGTEMTVNGKEVNTLFVGKFNAYNLLAVYGAAVLLGKKPEEVLLILSTLHSVSGRFQTFRSPDGYTAIVDYAHTPDALTNVLNTIHDVLEGKGKVITVVGCGGNRDKGKRPMMAKEAVRLSDKVILTSDNPRFEEPDDIIKDMYAGLDEKERSRASRITSREDAIKTACLLANTGDVVLVAGKGHENYQEIKGVKHHFDDREILNDIFKEQKQ